MNEIKIISDIKSIPRGCMKILPFFLCAVIFSGCTYSITMVHTEGQASDVVDETSTNTPNTQLTVPVSAIPK